jgi:hypothetical protein
MSGFLKISAKRQRNVIETIAKKLKIIPLAVEVVEKTCTGICESHHSSRFARLRQGDREIKPYAPTLLPINKCFEQKHGAIPKNNAMLQKRNFHLQE